MIKKVYIKYCLVTWTIFSTGLRNQCKYTYADVAELADALVLGTSTNGVGVQVPSSAPIFFLFELIKQIYANVIQKWMVFFCIKFILINFIFLQSPYINTNLKRNSTKNTYIAQSTKCWLGLIVLTYEKSCVDTFHDKSHPYKLESI